LGGAIGPLQGVSVQIVDDLPVVVAAVELGDGAAQLLFQGGVAIALLQLPQQGGAVTVAGLLQQGFSLSSQGLHPPQLAAATEPPPDFQPQRQQQERGQQREAATEQGVDRAAPADQAV
jgi:hypothetical protein